MSGVSRSKLILVVEDEADIVELIRDLLEDLFFQVEATDSADRAVEMARLLQPALVVMDWKLAVGDGVEAVSRIRQFSKVPVLMMSVHAGASDRAEALNVGADDYLSKPFHTAEFQARVLALLRRSQPPPSIEAGAIEYGPLKINPSTHEVIVDGRMVMLTDSEYQLLVLLARRPGSLVPRDELRSRMGEDKPITSSALDTHVCRLRRKLGRLGDGIHNIRGRGYRMKIDLAAEEEATG